MPVLGVEKETKSSIWARRGDEDEKRLLDRTFGKDWKGKRGGG